MFVTQPRLILTLLSAVLLGACGGSDADPVFSRNLQNDDVLQAALLANGLRSDEQPLPASSGFGRRPVLSARDTATIRAAVQSADGRVDVTLPLRLDGHQAAGLTRLSLRVAGASGHQFMELEAQEPGSDLDLGLRIITGSGETLPAGFCLDLVLGDALGRVSAPLRQCIEVQAGAISAVLPALAPIAADAPPRLSPLFLQEGLAAQWTLQPGEAGGTAPVTASEGNDLLIESIAAGSYLLSLQAGAFRDTTRLQVLAEAPAFSALIDGPDAVSAGETIRLFGDAGPQAAGAATSYRWLRDGVEVSQAQDLETATDAGGIGRQFEFQLQAQGADGAVASASITVIVRDPANLPPIARAGADQSVDEGSTVVLDGRQSSDLNEEPLSYQWEQIITAEAPAPRVALQDADQAQARFEAPDVARDQTLEFRLIVTDPQGNSDEDRVQILVRNDRAGGG